MLMASLIWSLCWVFIISLNKYLVPQIKRALWYLFISIINGTCFLGFVCALGGVSLGCKDGRLLIFCAWFLSSLQMRCAWLFGFLSP